MFGQQHQVNALRWLFQQLQQRVRRFLHESGRGDEEDPYGSLGRYVLRAGDHSANLAQLDQQLRRIGRNDEDIGMGLYQDAGVLLVRLAHLLAGSDGLRDARIEVRCFEDARTVSANAAEPGQHSSVFYGFPRLLFACERQGQHQRKRVFARTRGSRQDDGMRKAARSNGGAKIRNRVRIAQKVFECCWKGHRFSLPRAAPSICLRNLRVYTRSVHRSSTADKTYAAMDSMEASSRMATTRSGSRRAISSYWE